MLFDKLPNHDWKLWVKVFKNILIKERNFFQLKFSIYCLLGFNRAATVILGSNRTGLKKIYLILLKHLEP